MADLVKIKAFCNWCKNATNHTVKAQHNVTDIAEYENEGITHSQLMGITSFQIIECNGCESVSYRTVDDSHAQTLTINQGTREFEIIAPQTFETYYPERLRDWLVEDKIVGIPQLIRKAYREVIDCYNYDLTIMCSAGLRAVVESVCRHFRADGRTLQAQIDSLKANNRISSDLAEALHAHRWLGNEAVHNLFVLDKAEIKTAIELLEITLKTLFSVPSRRIDLADKMTKRALE